MTIKNAKVGRPALGRGKRRRLSMTLKPQLVAEITACAAQRSLSASRMVEQLLEKGLRDVTRERALWQAKLGVDAGQLAALCRAVGVKRLSLFGSVLTDDFGPKSDVDLLVEFKPGAVRTLLDRGRIQMELEKFFSRPVDLAELRLVDNPLRRSEILAHHQEIYAA